MANLQIKGIDNDFYSQIKKMAASESRSVSQQVLFLIKEHLSKKKQVKSIKTPAAVLLELSGSWKDSKKPEEIINEIKLVRKSSKKLKNGF